MIAMKSKPARKPDVEHRVQALSVPEIVNGMEQAAMRAKVARGLKFQGIRFRQGHAVNAVLWHFLSLPESEQDEMLAEWSVKFETMLAEPPAEDSRPENESEVRAIEVESPRPLKTNPKTTRLKGEPAKNRGPGRK